MKKEATKNASLADELATIPGGENLNLCIQCGTCSGSCPNVDYMSYSPRQIEKASRRASLPKIACMS